MAAVLATTVCTSMSSRQIYAEKSRKRRRCIVCRWEGRYPTEVTNYGLTRGVCLCRVVHSGPAKPWMCPLTTPTCWDKFHQFYYPNDLFTDMGNVRRHSNLAKLKDISEPMYSDLLPLAKLLTGCLAILLVTDSATKEIMDSVVKGLLRSG
ncbi:hypothetical protein PC110_g4230 [Phytophthora cactorum]|uniref:Uncharacterized protein n=1 Tax=Phytophthora cactorum TaxID=29920 RepID=A0A329SRE2_9STRA|nr:hypothetical protein PC110_g4230 [Phytophthora cactorum]